ncbi:hypothetical protein TREMEDRAFT_45806 [Tremella mesenterica DSM 1558]|uniref:uncharacterized protein n=1 Tax=Tremella mesenterica (strain ATCC 24925 / CBS 8224 / DSM 1558 / NBRC 9311 / NRRL Y-6157 / RJB 2259-6 / UBC 559-6) TaxID=578456 RepID=UPI00032D45AA|nr:uncharacterized protein TREMEDRAFT_45806 [Tremella mesenterica DSM 1558]EIW66341.1 hypothetical protein TREMEDRAFT_45806 [Tremella mesenterica DSM 1558]
MSQNPSIPLSILEDLKELSYQLGQKTHLLVKGGDGPLAEVGLRATKGLFDHALSLESVSHPHLHPFIISILSAPAPTLRSATRSISKPIPPPPNPTDVLPYTPLSGLTTDMELEQIWEQMELKTKGICRVLQEFGPEDGYDVLSGDEMDGQEDEMDSDEDDSDELEDEDSDELEDEDSDDEEEDDESEGLERLKRKYIAAGGDWEAMMSRFETDDGSEDDDDEGEDDEYDEDEDEEEEDDEDEDDENVEEEDDMDGEDDNDDIDGEDEEAEDEVMSTRKKIGRGRKVKLGPEESDGGTDEDSQDDEEEEDDDDEDDMGEDDDKPRNKNTRSHPTLDDDFFSISNFNNQTRAMEAEYTSHGALGGDEDDEELADMGDLMLNGVEGDEDVTYADFFEPPRGSNLRRPTKQDKSKSREKASKSKSQTNDSNVRFAEDLEPSEDDEEKEEAGDIIDRLKGDLFGSDDEEDDKNLSTFQKQQMELSKQIAELESEAIGPKDWTLLGEATARARPENSLLEEDLDFEQVGKVIPVITEESVKSLEDLIKQRIIDNNFDSPVRVRAFEPTPFLPSRYFELQDTQSTKSLAQIYEDEYQAVSSGTSVKDPRDEKLKKDHEEIERSWEEICYKLDALSSLNFVPKQPKAQITTISNTPTTSLETALPPTMSAHSTLAPEEILNPATSSALISRSELTPEEKQKLRMKNRKKKAGQGRKLNEMVELYGKKRVSAKEEKEKALAGLVKRGKGVTVVGKASGSGSGIGGDGKKRDRDRDRVSLEDRDREDGKRLKL